MIHTTWILVSDASRARLFQKVSGVEVWRLVEELAHPESRAHTHDVVTDRSGRSQRSGSASYSTAMEPQTPPKYVEMENFAHLLAGRLEQGFGKKAYDRLILIAPPRFLGLLRERLSDQVAKRVTASLDKDLS